MVFQDIMIDSIFNLPIAQTAIRRREVITTPGFERQAAEDLEFKFIWRRNLPVQTYAEYMNKAQEVQTDIYVKTTEPPDILEKDTILIDDAFGIEEEYMVVGGLDMQNGFTRIDLEWHKDGAAAKQ